MGYGAQANNIVKANRALLKKKRSFREIKDSYVGYLQDYELKFKNDDFFLFTKQKNKA